MIRRHPHGQTLIELLTVLAILGVIALIARPDTSPSAAPVLDARAAEVTAALRYARDEAVRTGIPVRVRLLADRVRVEVLDDVSDPPKVLSTAIHPVRRQPWERVLTEAPSPDLEISADPFLFTDGVRSDALDFHPGGWPMRRQEAGRQVPLDRSDATLTFRGLAVTVQVDPLTGTVSAR